MPPMISNLSFFIYFSLILFGNHLALGEEYSKIWHSYVFNSVTKNREGLKLLNFTVSNFGTIKNVQKWKSYQDEKGVSFLGLGKNFLELISLNGEIKYNSIKSDWNGYLSDIAVFKTWNARTKTIENFVVVANFENPRSILKWYKIQGGNLVYLWDWPINRIITHINVISFHNDLKLLIISHSPDIEDVASAEIYSFSITKTLDLWLYDKFSLDDNPSTTHMAYCNDNIYLIFALPKSESVFIYMHHETLTGQNHFKLQHKISSKNVISLTSFCFTFDCYVAIASSNSSIYKFNSNFDLMQVGETDFGEITKWFPIPISTFHEGIVLLAQNKNSVQVVSLFGDQQLEVGKELSQIVCGQDSLCVKELRFSADGATTFFDNTYHYILFTSTSGESKLLRFIVQTYLLQDDVDMQLKEIFDLQSLLQEKLYEQKKKMKELNKRINAITNKHDVVHPNSWKIEYVRSQSVTTVMEPNATINYFEFGSNENWIDQDYSIYVSLKTDKMLDDMDENLKKIYSMFYDVQRTSTIETPILSDLSVDNAIFSGSVTVGEVELSQLNGIDVNDMLENSFMFGSKRKIGGVKTVTDIKADYINFEKLNGISKSDIMFSDQLQDSDYSNIIRGSIVYENDITILEKLELLPNRDFSPSDLYPFQKGYQFMDEITFDHLSITKELVVEETLNGRPLILPLHSSPFEFFSSDYVNQARIEIVNVENDLHVNLINGRKISEILQEINEKSNSTSRNYLNNELRNITTRNLQIDYLNGIKFPEGFVTTKSGENVTITGRKNFTGRLIVGDLLLGGTGNDDNKSQPDSLKMITVGDMMVNGPLLTRKINNYTWDVLGDILKEDESLARITATKSIKKCNFSKNLILDELNSRNVTDVMNNFSDQEISGKTFNNVVFEKINITGTLDEMNIEAVKEQTVRLSESGVYESSLIFDAEEEPHFSRLDITDQVKNIKHYGKELIIYGDMKFKEIKTKVITINGSLESNDNINSVNLTEFKLNQLSLSKSQNTEGVFNRENTAIPEINTAEDVSKSRNANNTSEDFILSLLRSRSYIIDSMIVKGNVKTANGINGFNVTFIDQNAIYINKPCIIPNKIIFEDHVTFNSLKINDRIQGIQLKRLAKDLIFHSSHVHLRSYKNFRNILTVTDKMKGRSLNGHLIQRILTKEGDHSVKGSIIVQGDLKATGNITAYGLVNGSSMMDLMNKYSPKYESYVIKEDIVLQAEEINNLVVGGFLKNKSFNSFMEEVVLVKKDANITARKVILGSVKFQNNIEIADTMNGLDVTQFNRDIVLVNKDVDIEGDFIIGKSIMQNVVVRNDFNSTLIHGFDTNEWLEESIPLNYSTNVNGKKIFVNAESYNEIETIYLNGYLLANAIPLNKEQLIPCSSYFPRMTVMSDVGVEGWVNEKSLNAEFLDTVLIDEDQEIDGSVTFTNDFIVENDLTVHDSNKFDVITLYSDQTISSPIVFEDTVITNNAIDDVKYINNIDIKEWNERSISLNKNQVIQGDWFIEGNVTIEKNVLGSGLLNGESVPEIRKSITKVKMLAQDVENRIISNYNSDCQKIANLSRMVSHQPNMLRHFEISQILKTSVSPESVITFHANGNDYMMLTFFNECLSILYQWSKVNDKFNFVNRVNIGPVNKWITLHHENATYLITSTDSDVICEENSKKGNIWVFDGNGDKYGHLFTTEGFVDVIKAKRSHGKYYTLGDNGDIHEWNLTPEISSDFIANVGEDYKVFVEFEIFGELTLTDGIHVKNLQDTIIHTFAKPLNGKLTVIRMSRKKLVVVPYRDEIVLYEHLLQNKIFLSLPASYATSLIWFNSHSQHPLLVYEKEQKSIEIVNFQGAHGILEKIPILIPSRELLFHAMPRGKGLHSSEFLIVLQKKKVLLLEAYIAGNLYQGTGFQCK